MKYLANYSGILLLLFSFFSCSQKPKNIIADGANLTNVSEEFSFTEGPAVDAEGNVYFTDQPNNRIMKWTENVGLTAFMDSCGRSNGLYVDNNGKLLACADEHNQLWSIDTKTLEHEVLIDGFEGKKLNGPNDLWVDSKGGIYFTDPYYKRPWWTNPEPELAKQNLYYLLPDRNKIIAVDTNFVRPNGIIGTADNKTLYVADIGDSKTYVYQIEADGTLSNRKLFCEMGSDGMTLDNLGNLYLTGKGVTVFNAKGVQIEHIDIDEKWTANVTFGGKEQSTLFITAMKSVYTLKMNVHGIR